MVVDWIACMMKFCHVLTMVTFSATVNAKYHSYESGITKWKEDLGTMVSWYKISNTYAVTVLYMFWWRIAVTLFCVEVVWNTQISGDKVVSVMGRVLGGCRLWKLRLTLFDRLRFQSACLTRFHGKGQHVNPADTSCCSRWHNVTKRTGTWSAPRFCKNLSRTMHSLWRLHSLMRQVFIYVDLVVTTALGCVEVKMYMLMEHAWDSSKLNVFVHGQRLRYF
jgi:hypothetical protein